MPAAYAYAFDLLALDGNDMRRQPLADRKAALAKLLRKAKPGIRYSEHMSGDGRNIFEHACKLGLEGIVSKRINAPYRSGKVKTWLKTKNPKAAACAARAGRRVVASLRAMPLKRPTMVGLQYAIMWLCGVVLPVAIVVWLVLH